MIQETLRKAIREQFDEGWMVEGRDPPEYLTPVAYDNEDFDPKNDNEEWARLFIRQSDG